MHRDMQTVTLHDKTFQTMISAETIAERIHVLGKKIATDYADKRPLFLGVLNGAFIFAADLLRAVDTDCEISFVKLASYIGTASSGTVKTVLGMDQILRGRHVIVVEDIVDTGATLHGFLQELRKAEPASIALAACFLKPTALKHALHVDYLGFEIEDKFIVGFGLDYDGLGRNLPHVYQLVE